MSDEHNKAENGHTGGHQNPVPDEIDVFDLPDSLPDHIRDTHEPDPLHSLASPGGEDYRHDHNAEEDAAAEEELLDADHAPEGMSKKAKWLVGGGVALVVIVAGAMGSVLWLEKQNVKRRPAPVTAPAAEPAQQPIAAAPDQNASFNQPGGAPGAQPDGMAAPVAGGAPAGFNEQVAAQGAQTPTGNVPLAQAVVNQPTVMAPQEAAKVPSAKAVDSVVKEEANRLQVAGQETKCPPQRTVIKPVPKHHGRPVRSVGVKPKPEADEMPLKQIF